MVTDTVTIGEARASQAQTFEPLSGKIRPLTHEKSPLSVQAFVVATDRTQRIAT